MQQTHTHNKKAGKVRHSDYEQEEREREKQRQDAKGK